MPWQNGKYIDPADEYFKQKEQKKQEERKQAAFSDAVKSLGSMPRQELAVKKPTIRDYASTVPEGVSPKFAAEHPKITKALTVLSSPARWFMDTTAGRTLQRTSEKAGDAAFFINRRPEDYTDTGSSVLNKGADIAGFGVGTVTNPGGTGITSVTRGLTGLTKDATSFARGTADEVIGGAALRNPNNLVAMQKPVLGANERLLSNMAQQATKSMQKPTNFDFLKTAGKATAGSFGMDALQGAQTPDISLNDRSFASSVGASLRAGTGDLVDSLGSIADWTGSKALGGKLHQAGQNITKGYELPRQEFTWKSLLDPNFYAVNVARTLPSTAALIPLGVGGAVGGAAAGARAGLGSFGRTVMGALGASAASRPVESALEAAQTYKEAIRRGLSEEEADKAASEVFRNNLGLMGADAAQLGMAFMPAPIRDVGKIGKAAITATKVGAGAATEGLEEGVQEVIQRKALNDPISWDSDMKEAVVIGALLGGGMGMAGVAKDVMRNVEKKAFDSMPEETKKAQEATINQYIKSGMTPEQARAEIMNEYANTPEGRNHIEQVAKQVQGETDRALSDVHSDPRKLEEYIRNLPEQRVKNIQAAFATRLQEAVANNDIKQASYLQNRIRIFEHVRNGGNVPNNLLESYLHTQKPQINQLGMTDQFAAMQQKKKDTSAIDPTLLVPGAKVTFKGRAMQGEWELVEVKGDKAIVKRPDEEKTRTVPLKQVKEVVPPTEDRTTAEQTNPEMTQERNDIPVTEEQLETQQQADWFEQNRSKEKKDSLSTLEKDARELPIETLHDMSNHLQELASNGKDGAAERADVVNRVLQERSETEEMQNSSSERVEETESTYIKGKQDSAFTSGNQEIKLHYAVKDADSLITSNDTNIKENPNYPKELQPRDRTREGMVQQIEEIANKLNPKLLGSSPSVSTGAPVIGSDNIVESGNGRTIALKKVYEGNSKKAAEYKQYLIENAKEFGLSATDIERIERPVLVRVRETDVNRMEFAKQANAPETAALSATELALSDGNKISQGLMNLFTPDDNGNINTAKNRSFITEFMNQTMSTAERTRYMTEDGALNADGLRRVQNAVFARAYGDATAIEKLAEATETNVQNVVKGMLAAAPRMAMLKQGMKDGTLFNVDISSDLTAAMNKLSELRYEGRKVDAYLNQLSMLEEELTPEGKELLRFFDQARSIKAVKEMLLTYAHAVEAIGNPNQLGMFGEQQPTKAEVLEATFRRLAKDDQTLQVQLFADENSTSNGNRAQDEETRTGNSEPPTQRESTASNTASSQQTEKVEENRDQLVLQRVDQEPFVIKRGEYYRVYAGKKNGEKKYHIAKVIGLSRTNRTVRMIRDDSVRHNGVEYDIRFIYPLTEEEQQALADKNKPKDATTLTAVVDKVNKKNTPKEGFSEADKVWSTKEIGQRIKSFGDRLAKGEVTAQDVKDEFSFAIKHQEQAIQSFYDRINSLEKYKRKQKKTKQELANSAYRSYLKGMATVASDSYVMRLNQKEEDVWSNMVNSLTDEKIRTYWNEKKEKQEKLKQAIENPQTLDDFRTKLVYGVKLTSEEQTRYEELQALAQKEAQKSDKQKSSAPAAVMENDRFTIKEGRHTKTGDTIWIVNLKERVDGNEFKAIRAEMKKLGGYWSNYKPNNGFIFKEDPTELLGAAPVAEKKHQEISERKEQAKASKTAEKLREVADNMQKDIDAKRAERKTNTARRAAMAASAEADADAMTAQQKILRNIADAIESGKAVYLDGVTARTHIETLDHYLIRAKQNYQNVNNISYEKDSKKQVGPEDIAIFPYPKAEFYKERLTKLLDITKDTPGLKKDSRFLLNRIASKKSDYVDVTLHLDRLDNILREAVKMGGDAKLWAENIKDSLKHYKRLQTMGITTEAQFRSALREYLTYREGTGVSKEELKKRELKRRESELARTKIDGFFPTPTPIVKDMVERANIQTGDKVLEPSAGKGNIADIIREQHPDNALDVVEYNNSLASFLEEKGHNVVGSDFLEHKGKYDKIIMNPPFEKGQDIDHVRHAYELLKPGGKIVAIMSEGPFYRSDKKATAFREWMEEVGGISEEMDGAFKQAERQTGVKTRLVEIEKPSVKEPKLAEGTKAFFGKRARLNLSSKGQKTISRVQVINNMRKNLQLKETGGLLKKLRSKHPNSVNLVIDSGRVTKGVLGEYKVKPEVIRTAQAEDIATISHEIGHHLQKKFNILDVNKNQFDKELLPLGLQTSMTSYTPAQIREEGLSEFVRLYLTDPQQAEHQAPTFAIHFEQSLPNTMKKGLSKTQEDIMTWQQQGDYARAIGKIDFEGKQERNGRRFDNWYTRYLDDLNPLKIFEKEIKGTIGRGKDSIYKLARISRGVSEQAKIALTTGFYANGKKMGKSFADIVRPLEKMDVTKEEFVTYLAIKHAFDLKNTHGKQVPFTDSEMELFMNRFDGTEVQNIQKEVIEYNNNLLDVLVDAEIYTKDSVDNMKKMYPNYVPFMRYFEEDAIEGFVNGGYGSSKGFANLTNPIKRMTEEGSERTLIDPTESIIRNTYLVFNAAAKNKVGLALADLAKMDGAGGWVEALEEGGQDKRDHVVTVFIGGERKAFKIREPELYNAMLTLDRETTVNIVRVLGGFASILRAGATLTPEFIIRNPIRDIQSAIVNSAQYGFNPIDFVKGMGYVLNKDLRRIPGAKHIIKESDMFEQFLAEGGGYSTLMSMDRDALRESMKQIFRVSMKDKAMNVVTSPKELAKLLTGYTAGKTIIKGLRAASEVTELATKVGATAKVYKKTGDMTEAVFVARDLMDFNRAGTNIRQANQMIAFLNASLQGTDKMVRAFKENPVKTSFRAAVTLVLPAFLIQLWIGSLDDEKKKEYENIPQWQKDSFFIIPGPGDTWIRIPKPFEQGMIFATGTERLMRYYRDKDPEAFKEYGKAVLGAMTPPVLLTAFTPIIEALTNYNFFQNRNIIPQSEKNMERKDQYGIYTSETAKAIANVLNYVPFVKDTNFASPRIVDNTIKGYTAGLGQYALDLITDPLVASAGLTEGKIPQPAKKPSEKPLIKAFTVNTSGGGQIRDDFYKKWDELERKKNSAKKNREPYMTPEYARMKTAKNAMDKMMKMYKRIQNDPNMTPERKRELLDNYNVRMNDIARRGLNRKK